MDWRLHCSLWVLLATTSAYRSTSGGFSDYPNYGSAPYRQPYNRRQDYEPYFHTNYGFHQEQEGQRSTGRINEYGERTNENRQRTNEYRERINVNRGRTDENQEGTNTRPAQRMTNEYGERTNEDRERTNEYRERINENRGRTVEDPEGTNERPSQRMNERSIAVTSSIQGVQDQERKRLQTRDDEASRIENGTFKIINKSPVHSHSKAAEDGRVVFPDQNPDPPVPQPQTRFSIPNLFEMLPAKCKEIGICDEVPDQDAYNTIISSALQKLGSKKIVKSIDELEMTPNIEQRIGSDKMEQELCVFQEKVMTPLTSTDKSGDWHIVFNNRTNPIQGYRVEICSKAGLSCNHGGVFYYFPGYYGYCKQKYTFRPMTAVNKVTGDLYQLPLKVPSCCSCVAGHKTKT